jgi:hypothetical protein
LEPATGSEWTHYLYHSLSCLPQVLQQLQPTLQPLLPLLLLSSHLLLQEQGQIQKWLLLGWQSRHLLALLAATAAVLTMGQACSSQVLQSLCRCRQFQLLLRL